AVFSVRRHGGVPRARSSLAHRSGPPADAAPPVRWHLRFAGFMLVSVPQSRIIRTAGGDLIRRRARAGVRRVRLVQFDVPARQYPRRHDDSADTGKGRADTGQLQSELVHSPAIAWARIGVVLRSGPELDRAKKVGFGS